MKEGIQASFDEYGVEYDNLLLDKCVELCTRHGFTDSDEFADSWVAYSMSQLNAVTLNEKNLVRFERDVLSKQQHRRAKADILSELDEYNNGDHSTPDISSLKKSSRLAVSPLGGFSPASFSPTVGTPSSRYKERNNAGAVVCEKAGGVCELKKGSIFFRPVKGFEMLIGEEKPLHMSFHLTDCLNAADEHMHKLSERLSKKFKLPEYMPVNTKHPTSFVTTGRIVCDSEGRLNSQSVLLEGSPDECNGEVIRLDLTGLPQYSIFPGQVVAVEGINVSGDKLVVSNIWTDASITDAPSVLSMSEAVKIIVACGPFTPSDSLSYQPLMDLLTIVAEEEPHLLLLLGPLIDAEHTCIKENLIAETFHDYFHRIVGKIMDPLYGKKTQVALVPSWRDCHGAMAYPTPRYSLNKEVAPHYENLRLLADPVWFEIAGGAVVAGTSVDTLMHLGKEEIDRPAGGDRLARLVEHIIQQQSLYPLRPSASDIPLDPTFEKFLNFDCNPHLLILPSDLRYFIKEINGITVLNPGHLTKGLVGGSYGKMIINSNGNVHGQVLKI